MRKLAFLLVCCCAVPAQATVLLYDGFAPVSPDPGSEFNYRPGEPLAPKDDTTASPHPGQFNAAAGANWRYAGAGGTAATSAPGIASGSLSYSGLQASTGNSVAFNATQLGSARIGFTNQTSGTVYWSGLLRVNTVGTLTTGGAGGLPAANGMLVGGFNNAQGPGGLPSLYGSVLRIKGISGDATHYVIGGGLSSGTTSGSNGPIVQFDSTPRAEGDTVFVVLSYSFVAGANNDMTQIWINPAANTFGAGSAPPPTLTSNPGTGVADPVANVNSLNLRNVNTVGNPNFQFDELRVGTTWADVTPVPETSSFLLVGCALLLARKNAVKSLISRIVLLHQCS